MNLARDEGAINLALVMRPSLGEKGSVGLDKLRIQIDSVDEKLIALLNERAELVHQVAHLIRLLAKTDRTTQ